MGGITTGVGIFSGIDTASIIQQLLAIEARPRQLAQQRLFALQTQQAAYLDINSRLNALKTASSAFRTEKTFQSNKAVSSNGDVLTATANTSAAPGTYSFIVDQLVASQQLLSKGFGDQNSTAMGASSFTFESIDGHLDRDVSLSDLNGGDGVDRGKITLNDGSTVFTVDLSKSATVNEVLEAINKSGANVTARATDQGFVITHNAAGTVTIGNADDNETATSLGIVGSGTTITGSDVYTIADSTPLAALNDANGVYIKNKTGSGLSSFTIDVAGGSGGGGQSIKVYLGEVRADEDGDGKLEVVDAAESTLGGVLGRINDALEAAYGNANAKASISADGTSIELTDTEGRALAISGDTEGTAADLGLTGSGTGAIQGSRILSGINTTLVSTLNGGQGVGGDGQLTFTARDGTSFSVDVSGATTVQQILDTINNAGANGGAIVASLNQTGNGFLITDTTSGGGSFGVQGSLADNTADALGISTDADDAAAGYKNSGSLQHQYISGASLLANLNGGAGVGTGTFRITDSTGFTATIDIAEDTKTVADLIGEINSSLANVTARINDNGDGIVIEEDDDTSGALKIKIEDESGVVAKSLNLTGEATGVGDDNFIDGSYEQTVEFDAEDTLQDVANKINSAGVAMTATIINDGTGSTPFHLSLTSKASGVAGEQIVDTNGFDLGLETLSRGQDSKVFFGSSDPAKAVLLTSSTNTLDNVITGVSIDLASTSEDPIQLTISRDTATIETKVDDFVKSFNDLLDRIDFQTRYDSETETKGPLLGDGTLLGLRQSIYSALNSEAEGVTGSFSRLVEVGLTVGDGGKLQFDKERFRQALEQDPESVESLFAAYKLEEKDDTVTDPDGNDLDGITVNDPNAPDTFSELGVMGHLEQLAKRYIDTVNGVLTVRNRALDDQISIQQKRIDDFGVRLEAKQQQLEQQFLAMEQAIQGLQSQQQALGALGLLG